MPWHRYYLKLHETMLQEECGYRGAMPYEYSLKMHTSNHRLTPQPRYWNEYLDVPYIKNASVFDPVTGFGGNGVAPFGCIGDGPFANLTLRFLADFSTAEYCIFRFMNECAFKGAVKSNIDLCLTMKKYTDAWHCLENLPHAAGHAGTGGLVSSTD